LKPYQSAHIAEQMRYALAMGEGQKFEGAFPL
jgi:hypothetical protein